MPPSPAGDPEDLRYVVIFLRAFGRLDRSELSAKSGVSRNLIAAYEAGDKAPSRRTLERLAAAVGYPCALLEPLLSFIRLFRIAWEQGPWRPAAPVTLGEAADTLFEGAIRAAATLHLARLSRPREGDPEEARRTARDAWARLKALPLKLQRLAVPVAQGLCTWAGVEVLCAESERAAAHSAVMARELAELALQVADRVEPGIRLQAQAYAWPFMGNSLRVAGKLNDAEAAFVRAASLAQAAGGALSPLDGMRRLDLEASLRRDQRRPLEALKLLEHAGQAPRLTPIARARLLIMKAGALEVLGDSERALAVLREAEPAVVAGQDPRLLWLLRFGSAVNLCLLDRAAEAEALLRGPHGLRVLAEQSGNGLDKLRLRWLAARIAAGQGRTEEAIETLSGVRADFIELKMDCDAAVATSELAALSLEIGRTAEVKALTRQSIPIFHARGILPEARNALALFCEAVERETVTVALARRLVVFLERVQHDAAACFEP